MRQMALWDTACNFSGFISNQSIFNVSHNWGIYSILVLRLFTLVYISLLVFAYV